MLHTDRIGELLPLTRADVIAARRMVLACGIAADADDVTQEVLMAVHRRPHGFVIPPHLTPAQARRRFLWWIVRRKVADHKFARTRLKRGDGAAEHIQAAPSIEEQILETGPVTLLRGALATLEEPEPLLFAVLSGYLSGLSVPQAAAVLEIPAGTAYTRWRRGVAALRAVLSRWADEDSAGAARAALIGDRVLSAQP